MRIGLTVSIFLHVGLLVWALISIGGAKPLVDTQSIPVQVELLTVAELTEIRKGAERSKIKEPKPEEAAKSVATPDAAKPKRVAAVEPPKPEPPKPEPPKPEPPKPEPPKPEPPKPEPPKPEPPKPEAKADPIAEALAKAPPEPEPPKPEPKAVEKPKPDEAKPPAKPTDKAAEKPKAKPKPKPKVDLAQMQALLNKLPNAGAKAQADGDADPKKSVFDEAFGANEASGTKLSVDEASMLSGMFRSQVQGCWSVSAGGTDAESLNVRLSVMMNQDGTVVGTPRVLDAPSSALGALAAENAVRAVLECQPYKMPADKFEYWRAINIFFDPQKMFGN
jgi:hypothetical protein